MNLESWYKNAVARLRETTKGGKVSFFLRVVLRDVFAKGDVPRTSALA
jgi:hypothetical protein